VTAKSGALSPSLSFAMFMMIHFVGMNEQEHFSVSEARA
jgi:hypothetical protein